MKKYIALFAVSIENLKNPNFIPCRKKHYFFLLLAVSGSMKMKSYLKKKNQWRY